ncbi:thioredoxin family protein [Candidatus Bathyarchaeota archaeon]|nr:thioredoxin family protein [Candidatus Bathyarchaeota archaeon]
MNLPSKGGCKTPTIKIEVFYTPICPHCPHAIEVVRKVTPQFGDKVQIEEVNAWTLNGQLRAAKYHIYAVPAIAIDGQVRFVGTPSEDKLAKVLKEEFKKLNQ